MGPDVRVLWCVISTFIISVSSRWYPDGINNSTSFRWGHASVPDLLLDRMTPGGGSADLKCNAAQFACADGRTCVPAHWRCDGHGDCPDNSDEPRDCEVQSSCPKGQFHCKLTSRCIPGDWRCDGDFDCGQSDKSDEDPHQCNVNFKCPPNKSRCESAFVENNHTEFSCLPTEQFCDGVRQCPDNSDEWDQCSAKNTQLCKQLNCSYGCKPTREGPTCYCPQGQEPQGTKCLDTNECLLTDTCEQICKNTVNSYTCSCVEGYKKQDEAHCTAVNEPENEKASFIITTQRDLRRITMGEALRPNMTLPALGVTVVDFDFSSRKICYIHNNLTKHSFVCVNADDFTQREIMPSPKLFPDLTYISHISFDWVSSNWYFVDGLREVIYACDKKLKICRIILDSDLNKVRGYVLDPTRGYQIWSTWGLTPVSISRSNLDGSDRKQIVTQKLVYPQGLTVYLPTGRIYWIENYLDYIESADIDGNNRITLKKGLPAVAKFNGISVFESKLYVPLSIATRLLSLSRLRANEASTIDLHFGENLRVVYIDVFHRQKQPRVKHPCQTNNGGCDHMCLTGYSNNQSVAICVCAHGFRLRGHGGCVRVKMNRFLIYAMGTPPMIRSATLNTNEKDLEPMVPITDVGEPNVLDYDVFTEYVYYSDTLRYEISRQKIDGTGHERFITSDVISCAGLAVDWLGRNLYWTDSVRGRVNVARLDNGTMNAALVKGPINPRSIALDPVNGKMYWADWSLSSLSSKIESAYMDGSERKLFVTDGLYWPSGLTIDYDFAQLYWCDLYLNKIESIKLSSNERVTVATTALRPYGLAVSGPDIFWTEHETGLIRHRLPPGTNILKEERRQLFDLKLYDANERNGSNACSRNRTMCPELCLAVPNGAVCRSADEKSHKQNLCPPRQFHCGDQMCIDNMYVCDGDYDCPNQSDESREPGGPCHDEKCEKDQFTCDTNRCLDRSSVCDGNKDCNDGADESQEMCHAKNCTSDLFTCKISGKCIPIAWRCDGAFDCGGADKSDEDCPLLECDETMFHCTGGTQCVSWDAYCDGKIDCSDRSDEVCRTCFLQNEFFCEADVSCISASLKCNGRNDCSDGADEENCKKEEPITTSICEEHEFQCKFYTECIRKEFRCDMRSDCIDASDEQGCDYAKLNVTTTPAPSVTNATTSLDCGTDSTECDNGTRCIPYKKMCDHVVDCRDGSDESISCSFDLCHTSECSHMCQHTPKGPVCYCPEGLHLQADGLTCNETNPCADYGACSQICTSMKYSHHKCSCTDGYALEVDGFTCKPTDKESPYLVYADKTMLGGFAFVDLWGDHENRFHKSLFRPSSHSMMSLSFFTVSKSYILYWTRDDTQIYRGRFDGASLTKVEAIMDSVSIKGLAVDWIGKNLYWLDEQNIMVSKLDGSSKKALLAGDLGELKALAIDSRDGLMFWTDVNSTHTRMERSSLSGLRRKVIINMTETSNPCALTLDFVLRRIYWIDARYQTIQSATYDGEDILTVLTSKQFIFPTRSLDLFMNQLYWTNRQKLVLYTANRFQNGSSSVSPFDLKRNYGSESIILLHPSRQPSGPPNPCEVNNGNCSHLCLVDGPGTKICSCPFLMFLKSDFQTCQDVDEMILLQTPLEWIYLWSDGEIALSKTFLNGQKDMSTPVAYHTEKKILYWPKNHTISRRNFTLSLMTSPEPLPAPLLYQARLVAVDMLNDLLYIFVVGKNDSAIFATNLEGERPTKIVGDAGNVNGLKLDPINGMMYYSCSEKRLSYINSSRMDGSERSTIYKTYGLLKSLSLSGTYLYFIDDSKLGIQKMDLIAKKVYPVLAEPLNRPDDIALDSKYMYYSGNGTLYRCDFRNHCFNFNVVRRFSERKRLLALSVFTKRPDQRSLCEKKQCQHLCVMKSRTEAVCKCAEGYQFADNTMTSCKVIDNVMLYATQDSVEGVSLDGNSSVVLFGTETESPVSLDFYAATETLFLKSHGDGSTRRMNRDGSGRKVIVPSMLDMAAIPLNLASDRRILVSTGEFIYDPPAGVKGLAVDWMAGNIYWTDPMSYNIEVATVDGRYRTIVYVDPDDHPNGLAIDPSSRYLFLLCGLNIKRMFLDGTNATTLFKEDSNIVDVALDYQKSRFYYATEKHIKSMTYDGKDLTNELEVSQKDSMIKSIEIHGNVLYWAESDTIFSAPLNALKSRTVFKQSLGRKNIELQIYASDRQRGSNECTREANKCAELCLMGSKGAICKCRSGKADGYHCIPPEVLLMYSSVSKIESLHLIDEGELNSPQPPIEDKNLMDNAVALSYDYDRSLLFYSNLHGGTINVVSFNGTNHRTLLECEGVEGIQYDTVTDTLFWTTSTVPAVRKVALSGNATRLTHGDVEVVVLMRREDKPRGIDVDPCEARIYWTTWNSNSPSIKRAYTNGYGLQAIVTTDIIMPNALTLDHPAKKMYWVDARLDKIERCAYDGSNRVIVRRLRYTHPFDIAVFNDFIYWSDWIEQAIFRSNKHSGAQMKVLKDNITPRPLGVVAVAPHNHSCTLDNCSSLQGLCSHECRVDGNGKAFCACRSPYILDSDGYQCKLGPIYNCQKDQFSCKEGICIPMKLTCDGVRHCSDSANASDEDPLYCMSRKCPSDMFGCQSGARCLDMAQKCDGVVHCPDGSDEKDCNCPPLKFRCNDGTCINESQHCDGKPDCSHYEDEINCPRINCRAEQKANCKTSNDCYDPKVKCDGNVDCMDGSDEDNCSPSSINRVNVCGEGTVTCNDGECILAEWVCDGFDDCLDGNPSSDEKDCKKKKNTFCAPNEFKCAGTFMNTSAVECVSYRMLCDGIKDCSDGSDEGKLCARGTLECQPWQFTCRRDGKCVSLKSVCDGTTDCPDGSDETACNCPDPQAFRCADSLDCLDKVEYCDGHADCLDESDEPPGCVPFSQSLFPRADCAVQCANKACVSRDLLCDGRDHCEDGKGPSADEDPVLCASLTNDCKPGEWSCKNGACVTQDKLCDGNNQCGDFSDEENCHVNECDLGVCQQNCTELIIGYACWCRAGFRSDHALCHDVNECEEDEPCDHNCRNTYGSYVCSCKDGFTLAPDKVTCIFNSAIQANLLFTNRYYIRSAGFASNSPTTVIVHNLTNAVALDFDWASQCYYWSDVTRQGSSIKRYCGAGIAGAKVQVLHSSTVQNPDGLAVDWVGGNLYWCDKGTDTVEVSRLDGKHRKIIIKGDLQEPRAVVLNPSAGTLYWSDWGDNPHIGRAGMDGSQRTVIIQENLGWPNALTISYDTNELFFADAREDYIAVANLDGTRIKKLFSKAEQPSLRLHHVFAVAVWSGYVYWSDWETKSIEACKRRFRPANATLSDSLLQCHSIVPTIFKPMDLRIYHPHRQVPMPDITQACEKLNCSGLCLLTPNKSEPVRCACPENFILESDGRSCKANCSVMHFQCESVLKCIPAWYRCDTQDDCGDGSDEPFHCPKYHCSPGEFQCDTNRCVHPKNICDGNYDCDDKTDERNCDLFSCLSSQFKCAGNATMNVTARCIPSAKRCDGKSDCPGGVDELDCPPATCSDFKCDNGNCIPLVWVCDQSDDCGDNSDENAHCENRQCGANEFRCAMGRCIPMNWVCDKESDCTEGEDEAKCDERLEPTCNAIQFKCNSGKCIPLRWRCDHEYDCDDKTDEINCNYQNCTENQFRCDDGLCIDVQFRCDGSQQCPDGSDERSCNMSCGKDLLKCKNGQGCIFKNYLCDGDMDCMDGSDEEECNSATSCTAPYRNCSPHQCVLNAHACDGMSDCANGSDEVDDFCAKSACAPPMFRCKDNHRCIPSQLRCDGVDDCGDNSDEIHMYCLESGECLANEFKCESGLCINETLKCDGENNCGDNSDEMECKKDPCEAHSCSQMCIPKDVKHKGKGSGYSCRCGAGFTMRGHGEKYAPCEANGRPADLILSSDNGFILTSFYKIEEEPQWLSYQNDTTDKISGFAVHFKGAEPWLYWVEERTQAIRRCNLVRSDNTIKMGTTETLNPAAGSLRSIAVDYVSERIYWTVVGTTSFVKVATLDGLRERTLVRGLGGAFEDIVLHLQSRRMIWSDWGPNPSIEIADMSGSNRKPLVTKRVWRPSGLALDSLGGRLYWSDLRTEQIEVINLDGARRRVLVDKKKEVSASFIPRRLDLFEEHLVGVWRDGLFKMNKRTNAISVIKKETYRSTDVAVLHESIQDMLLKDPCKESPCHPSALCLQTASVSKRVCVCPDGSTITYGTAEEDHKCTSHWISSICADGCGPGECYDGRCICPPAFSGTRCEHFNCADQCLHRGTCVMPDNANKPHEIKCECTSGWTGAHCEVPVTECEGVYCHNGGTCQPGGSCFCSTGYRGKNCEICVGGGSTGGDKTCGRYGICSRGAEGPVCVCPSGYKQPDCQCGTECYNEGDCFVSEFGMASCKCKGGWRGTHCEERDCGDKTCPLDLGESCDGIECAHEGNCVLSTIGALCKCTSQWAGARCNDYVGWESECRILNCIGDSFCVLRPPAAPFCASPSSNKHYNTSCLPGTTGLNCAVPVPGNTSGEDGNSWTPVAVALVTVVVLVLLGTVGFMFLKRRSHGPIGHARLTENVEITNPMYLKGDDDDIEVVERRDNVTGILDGTHFANPVYESMYNSGVGGANAPAQTSEQVHEERANLLAEACEDINETPPPPSAERSLLL